MELHDKQKEIVSSKARFKVVRAGRRAGKSVLEVESMVFKAISGKDRNIYYLAPNQTQARDIIWLILRSRLHNIATFNEARLEALVPTVDGGTSLIKLSGWENKENFRGKSAYHITVDEIDTMRDFFQNWKDIFRPTLIDTAGSATFIGTPKKENPNLKRLEKVAEDNDDYETFHFNTFDNPHLPAAEKDQLKEEYKDDPQSYKQEILAEHITDSGALFNYTALVDVFSNTIDKTTSKYLIVDIADDGSDKSVFSFWEGLEEYRRESFPHLNTEGIIEKIREYASEDKIPYSHIAVDAIGVGAGVASSSMLDGIVGYKSSYSPIKTDIDIVRLPNVGHTNESKLTSDYRNLRSQCVFTLAGLVNTHKIASKVSGRQKEVIIEELHNYQDVSKGDGKRQASSKDDIKSSIGRSPDDSDTWLMRMYFVVKEKMIPGQSEEQSRVILQQQQNFMRNFTDLSADSTR